MLIGPDGRLIRSRAQAPEAGEWPSVALPGCGAEGGQWQDGQLRRFSCLTSRSPPGVGYTGHVAEVQKASAERSGHH